MYVYIHTDLKCGYSSPGSLSLDTIDIWDQMTLRYRDWPVPCRILNSILGFYPLAPLSCDKQKCLQIPDILLWGKITPPPSPTENHYSNPGIRNIIILNSKIGRSGAERGKNTCTSSQVDPEPSKRIISIASWSRIRIL